MSQDMLDCMKPGKRGIAPAPCGNTDKRVIMAGMAGSTTPENDKAKGDPCPAGKVGAGVPSGGDGKTGPSPNILQNPNLNVSPSVLHMGLPARWDAGASACLGAE